MLGYIGPIIVLVTGVLGIFFSKTGERQKLAPIAYLFLAFVVVAGIVSVAGVYLADAAALKKQKEEEAKTATALAAARREKERADSLRGMLLATTFEPNDRPTGGLLIFDLPMSDADAHGEESPNGPLWPLAGPGVRITSITFKVEGVVDIDYRLTKTAQSFDIAAHWYRDENRICRLTGHNAGDFAPVPQSQCNPERDYTINAALDGGLFKQPFVIRLPNKMFLKTYSRIEQVQRMSGRVGQLVIEADSPNAMPALLAAAREIVPSLKFFRPYLQARAEDKDECVTSLTAVFETSVKQTGPRTITVDIPRMESFDLSFCEISPI